MAIPLGVMTCVTGRLRLGQDHPGHRHPVPGPGPAPLRQPGEGRQGRGDHGAGAARQGDRHRPVAHRPHPALQPGHLHRRLHRHPRPLRPAARGQGARLQAGPLLLQCQGGPLRGLPGRRHHQDRDALSARRLRPVRGLQGGPLQPRDAGGQLQGQDHCRRAGHDRQPGRASFWQNIPRIRTQAGNPA